MEVIKTDSIEPVIGYIVDLLQQRIGQSQQVLWMLSGGSAVPIAVEARRRLSVTQNLTVGLVDERFGAVGHKDSNWQQLARAGFDFSGIKSLPVLQGKSFEETIKDYELKLQAALQDTDYSLGLFGMGADGHTAGILPNSLAASEIGHDVVGYQGPDYLRVTTTFACIKRLDEAVLCAYGDAKKPALERLIKEDVPLAQQPAQILKQVKKLIIYNDQLGEAL